MSTKKWLLALVVVGVLALAFFWNDIPRSSTPKLAIGTSEKQAETADEGKSPLLDDQQNTAEQEKSQGSNKADQDKLAASSVQEQVNADSLDQTDKVNGKQEEKPADDKQLSEKTTAGGKTEGSSVDSTTESSKTPEGKQEDRKSTSNSDKSEAGSSGSKGLAELSGSAGSKSADKSGAINGTKPVETPSQSAGGASKPGEKPPVAGKDTKPVEPAKPATTKPTTTKPATTKPAETSKSGGTAGKDKYLTDPVPEGKPKPVEWQDVTINKKKQLSATLSVSSKTIFDNLDKLDKDKLEVLPEDGIIYKKQTVTFSEGESVFDVLLREMKKNKIHMEFSMTPIYNSNYIEGINNLYEFDCGELSGWMFKVNDWFPNYGASRYVLKDGDVIEWVYTCDLGRDVGGDGAVGGRRQ